MAISNAWYVRCDGCGDPTEISTTSAKEARTLARAYGGYRRKKVEGRMMDLCPGCQKLRLPKEPADGRDDGPKHSARA
jgi:hypothetical protein